MSRGRLAVVFFAVFAAACGRLSYESHTRCDGACATLDSPPGQTDAGPEESLCGDGVVSGDEACDDENALPHDGCEGDCTFSCVASATCVDAITCNGDETCNPGTHACESGTPLGDGAPCAGGNVCRAGSCALPSCGDAMPDPGEDCDDGNVVVADGCENDCTFSCEIGEQCADGQVCNGTESCDASTHTCVSGTAALVGADCDRDGLPSTRDICVAAMCVRARCGDAYLDAASGELCDDGNTVNGDGCDDDCAPSCTVDADCADGLVCNGVETCAASTCEPGTDAPDGTSCLGGACAGGACSVDGGVSGTDGGITGAPDGGSAGGCERRGDCDTGEQCCATCPTFPGICWPNMIVCPLVTCKPEES